MLGLSLHVNIFFMSENQRFWNAGEYHGDPINEGISFFIFQFRMPLFFILAGFFAALVIERKGVRHLVVARHPLLGYHHRMGSRVANRGSGPEHGNWVWFFECIELNFQPSPTLLKSEHPGDWMEQSRSRVEPFHLNESRNIIA